MRKRDAIVAPKTLIRPGTWKVVTGRGGKNHKDDFPLDKKNFYVPPRGYHWRVDILEENSREYRLMTAFYVPDQEFRSLLSLKVGELYAIICRLEFHGTHPGWHVHAQCRDEMEFQYGVTKGFAWIRAPGGWKSHRRTEFEITESSALSTAFKFYGVHPARGGTLT